MRQWLLVVVLLLLALLGCGAKSDVVGTWTGMNGVLVFKINADGTGEMTEGGKYGPGNVTWKENSDGTISVSGTGNPNTKATLSEDGKRLLVEQIDKFGTSFEFQRL